MTGGRRVGALVLLAGLLLAGCGSGGGEGSAAPTGTAGGPGGVGGLVTLLPGSSGGGSPSPTGGTTGSATTGATSTTPASPAATRTLTSADLPYTFVTPSKNIACQFTDGSVRCDIAQRVWNPPPKPSSCEVDYGHGLYVGDGRAGFTCAGDTVLGDPAATALPYGHSISLGDLTCDSQLAGVRCRNSATGRGFTLAKEAGVPF